MEHKTKESPWPNLIFNILLPVFILNKGNSYIGPLYSLIAALSFPLFFGLYDYAKKRKMNVFSALGLINVGITGGLALAGLGGIWFSVKEAAFPLLVGVFVAASAFSRKPFMGTLFFNPQVINIDLIDQRLDAANKQKEFEQLMSKATLLLSLSFLFSAIANFVLAHRIFLPLPLELSLEAQREMLNKQLGEMTKWSMLVLMLPSMAFMLGLFFYVVKKIQGLTGLSQEEIFPDAKS